MSTLSSMMTAALSISSGVAQGGKWCPGNGTPLPFTSICFCLRRLHQTIIHSTAASPQRLFQEERFRKTKCRQVRCERPAQPTSRNTAVKPERLWFIPLLRKTIYSCHYGKTWHSCMAKFIPFFKESLLQKQRCWVLFFFITNAKRRNYRENTHTHTRDKLESKNLML